MGIVGAAGRGGRFKLALDAIDSVSVRAVCDIDAEGLVAAAKTLGAEEPYLDYDEMLARSDLDELADEFLPDRWCTYGDLAKSEGHGGGDLLQIIDFVEVIRCGEEPAIGVHQSMDMTLPGLG